MALDIVSVQASSVALNQHFFNNGRIFHPKNKTTAESLEMCMCLKDTLRTLIERRASTQLHFELCPLDDVEEGVLNDESESGNVKGAPECMRISGFVHGITNPELIKRFHEKIPNTVDEMMQVATSFLQGQEAASNQERKKVPSAWSCARAMKGFIGENFKKGVEGSAANISTEKRPEDISLFSQKPRRRLRALRKRKIQTPDPVRLQPRMKSEISNKFESFTDNGA
ncbi:hypothetical protein Tco_1253079 [Tanacetum coccineum]